MNKILNIKKFLDKLHFWKSHFEALLNRDATIEKYLKTHKIKKLQVGCGEYILPSWLNSDLYGNERITPIDLTKRLPFADNTLDYIFSEHVIEHISFTEGEGMLKEMLRILKPGGKIRVATPNLKSIVDLYNKNKTDLQKEYIKVSTDIGLPGISIYSDVLVINNLFRAWGHQFIYDLETMRWLLKKIGFVDIKKFAPENSDDSNLKNLEKHWKLSSKQLYNLETFVVEATKPKEKI